MQRGVQAEPQDLPSGPVAVTTQPERSRGGKASMAGRANETMSRRRKATANNLKKKLTKMFTLLLPGSSFALPALISLETQQKSLLLIA